MQFKHTFVVEYDGEDSDAFNEMIDFATKLKVLCDENPKLKLTYYESKTLAVTERNIITVKELAQYLHVGMNKAYKLCKQTDFPVVMVGNKKFVDRIELDKWLEGRSII